MLFLPRSLVLFVSLDLIPFASALFKQRESKRERDHAHIMHPSLSIKNDKRRFIVRVSLSSTCILTPQF